MQKSSQGLTLHADVCMVFSHCFDCCLVESLLHLDSQYCPCSQHYVFLLDLEFEGREFEDVLRNAFKLRGKPVSIHEQFPAEIENRRKQLYQL
jgi:hypothetical protein